MGCPLASLANCIPADAREGTAEWHLSAEARGKGGAVTEREAFEKWVKDGGFKPQIEWLGRNADGEYISLHTRMSWLAWQARAALGTIPPIVADDN